MGLVSLLRVESSWTRDWTHAPCTGRQILNHWTTKEAQKGEFKGGGWGHGVGHGLLWNLLLITDASPGTCRPRAVSFTSVLSSPTRGISSISQIGWVPHSFLFQPWLQICRAADFYREEQKSEPRDSQHLSQSCFHLGDLSELLTKSHMNCSESHLTDLSTSGEWKEDRRKTKVRMKYPGTEEAVEK